MDRDGSEESDGSWATDARSATRREDEEFLDRSSTRSRPSRFEVDGGQNV